MLRNRLALCLLVAVAGTTLTAVPEAASGAPAARVIRLAITPPGKDAPTSVIATHENESVTVHVPDLGNFGFTPVIGSDNRTVVVTIFDNRNDGHKRLGEVQAPVGGKVVQSKTEPSFGIKIVSVSSGSPATESR